jgi:hypothetical protein
MLRASMLLSVPNVISETIYQGSGNQRLRSISGTSTARNLTSVPAGSLHWAGCNGRRVLPSATLPLSRRSRFELGALAPARDELTGPRTRALMAAWPCSH